MSCNKATGGRSGIVMKMMRIKNRISYRLLYNVSTTEKNTTSYRKIMKSVSNSVKRSDCNCLGNVFALFQRLHLFWEQFCIKLRMAHYGEKFFSRTSTVGGLQNLKQERYRSVRTLCSRQSFKVNWRRWWHSGEGDGLVIRCDVLDEGRWSRQEGWAGYERERELKMEKNRTDIRKEIKWEHERNTCDVLYFYFEKFWFGLKESIIASFNTSSEVLYFNFEKFWID